MLRPCSSLSALAGHPSASLVSWKVKAPAKRPHTASTPAIVGMLLVGSKPGKLPAESRLQNHNAYKRLRLSIAHLLADAPDRDGRGPMGRPSSSVKNRSIDHGHPLWRIQIVVGPHGPILQLPDRQVQAVVARQGRRRRPGDLSALALNQEDHVEEVVLQIGSPCFHGVLVWPPRHGAGELPPHLGDVALGV